MKSFAFSCLIAASASALNLQSGSQATASLKPIVLDMPESDPAVEARDSYEPAYPISPLDQLVQELESGFEKIEAHNQLAEKAVIEDAQDAQESAIEEIIEQANEEAAEIIEDESDASEAADEVEEVYESRQDEIAEVNEEHDEDVIAVSKKTVAATINNEAIKNQVIGEVVDAAIYGGDVN